MTRQNFSRRYARGSDNTVIPGFFAYIPIKPSMDLHDILFPFPCYTCY